MSQRNNTAYKTLLWNVAYTFVVDIWNPSLSTMSVITLKSYQSAEKSINKSMNQSNSQSINHSIHLRRDSSVSLWEGLSAAIAASEKALLPISRRSPREKPDRDCNKGFCVKIFRHQKNYIHTSLSPLTLTFFHSLPSFPFFSSSMHLCLTLFFLTLYILPHSIYFSLSQSVETVGFHWNETTWKIITS